MITHESQSRNSYGTTVHDREYTKQTRERHNKDANKVKTAVAIGGAALATVGLLAYNQAKSVDAQQISNEQMATHLSVENSDTSFQVTTKDGDSFSTLAQKVEIERGEGVEAYVAEDAVADSIESHYPEYADILPTGVTITLPESVTVTYTTGAVKEATSTDIR